MGRTINWESHHLTEYLVHVSVREDQPGAMLAALEQAIDALDAEVAAIIDGTRVLVHVGFGRAGAPDHFAEAAAGQTTSIPLFGKSLFLVRSALDQGVSEGGLRMVAGRISEPFSAEETHVVQAMGLILGLVLNNLRALELERSRTRLIQQLLGIQRMISARQPLQELFDGVTSGASSLLDGRLVALFLVDPDRPDALIPASTYRFADLAPEQLAALEGVILGQPEPNAQPLDGSGLIAAPVAVEGSVAGCLVARVCDPEGRAAQAASSELLAAFGQQVSLALTDARTLDAIREAYQDAVTGLPNRSMFLQRMERSRHAALAEGHELTVLFIDLDRFKAVNDTLGHKAGDALLAEVARRIQRCIRARDVAARLGGDEFAVLLTQLSALPARAVADRIIGAIARPFVIEGHEVLVGASVGIASLAGHTTSAVMLSDADIAMYNAKNGGGGRSVIFEQQMLEDVAHKLALRTDLQHAVEQDQLWLAYQPIVVIGPDGIERVERVEGLMRWNHPERGLLMPGAFIGVAEETDTILSLGEWAIRQGLRDLARWRQTWPELGLCLNASVRQIVNPRFPAVVRRALSDTGLPGRALTLEITESILMADPRLASRQLQALKGLDVRLAIDDFGTGYSSLAYMRRFPVDEVKIDRDFIAPLDPAAIEDIAVVRSVLTLCRSLRLETVAEGIETTEQLQVLADLGCDLGQGYLFARPMAAPDCEAYLAVMNHARSVASTPARSR